MQVFDLDGQDDISGPVVVSKPCTNAVPVVVSSPHSGRCYPQDFIASSRLDRLSLRRSEDSFVDELFASAPGQGAAMIAATFPRAFCDVNREAWELDPAMFEDTLPAWVNTTSARVGSGLGTLARVVSNGAAIYAGKLKFQEAERRVHECWQPYHDALGGLVSHTLGRFGACVLLDCHSMPAHACEGRVPAPDIVLGDAHGCACAPGLVAGAQAFLTSCGYIVRRNDPYAGGYVTRHYGNPRRHVHALQIELARSLYMDEGSMEKHAGFERLEAAMSGLVEHLAVAALSLV